MAANSLPARWRWLLAGGGPRIIVQAAQLYGTIEVPGPADNPIIMAWAREIGAPSWYAHDKIPWCGLFAAVVVQRAGKQPPVDPLVALNWRSFGQSVDRTKYPHGALGDVLVFRRKGGGHVAFYVGESADGKYVYILGGNQDDAVNIKRRLASTIVDVRRPVWATKQPDQVRRVRLSADMAPLSGSEQ